MIKQNYISFLLIVFSIFSVGFITKTKITEAKHEEASTLLNENLMEAKLEIGRAKTKFGDASKEIKKLEKELKKDIEDKDSFITRYGELEAKYEKLKNKRVSASINIVNNTDLKECDSLDLEEGQLYVVRDQQLGELAIFAGKYTDERIVIDCSVIPKITSSGVIPFDISYSMNLNFKGEILETITPSGAINNYINIYEVNKEEKVIGKLEISNFKMTVDDQRTPGFLWWSPHLDIGVGLGSKATSSLDKLSLEGSASLGLSIMSYGFPKEEPIWRFVRLGLDIGEEVSIGLTPVLYNVGKNLPLLDNLWVGGFGHYGLNTKTKTMGLMFGASL